MRSASPVSSAWTALYIMMAVSAWLVWREVGFGTAIAVFGLQLALNFLWTAIFFGMKRPDLALYEVILLWLTILACLLLFMPVSGWAALLLLPYLAWTGFAGFLNLAILRLNGSGRIVGVALVEDAAALAAERAVPGAGWA